MLSRTTILCNASSDVYDIDNGIYVYNACTLILTKSIFYLLEALLPINGTRNLAEQ